MSSTRRRGETSIAEEVPDISLVLHYLRSTWREIRHNKLHYCLGFSAVMLVVLVVALLITVLQSSPVVFLRLSELDEGEIDLAVSAGSWTGFSLVNYTRAAEVLAEATDGDTYSYHAPRHEGKIGVFSLNECTGSAANSDPYSPQWKYFGTESTSTNNYTCRDAALEDPVQDADACFVEQCTEQYGAYLYVLDFELEERMDVGRAWEAPAPEYGSVYLKNGIATALNVTEGDLIFLQVDVETFLGNLWNSTITNFLERESALNPDNPELDISSERRKTWRYVYVPAVVQLVYTDPSGKHPVDRSSAILINYRTFLPQLLNYSSPDIPEFITNEFDDVNLYSHAAKAIFNLPPPRYDVYINPDMDSVIRDVVAWSGEILYRIGFNQLSTSLPVMDELEGQRFTALFLGLLLNVIIFIMVFLSILLIYSLLMVSVESRTFEMGILRMIGMTRMRLIQLLLTQAFSYSLPAWVAGLVVAQVLGIVVSIFLGELTGVAIGRRLTAAAVLVATALGILVPILAAVFPIRAALGKNLHDSIDIRRSKTKAVKVVIERSEDTGVSAPMIITGIFLTLFGFFIYYVFPLSLLTEQIALLLYVFFFLLIGMLLGLIILSMNFQHTFERLTIYSTLWWDRSAILIMVVKNLVAHRPRNRKTAIMYALSLGFVIFISVASSVQTISLLATSEQRNGAYLKVYSSGVNEVSGLPNRITIVEELEAVLEALPVVESYSWLSAQLSAAAPGLSSTRVTNLGHVFSDGQSVYCVSPNYFENTAVEGYLRIYDQNETQYSLLEQLHTVHGSASGLMGSAYLTRLGLEDLQSRFILQQELSTRQSNGATIDLVSYDRLVASAYMESAPLFDFSPYPNKRNQDFVVSCPSYVRLTRGLVTGVQELPMQQLLIKLINNATDDDIDDVKGELGRAILEGEGLRVFDFRDTVRPIEQANQATSFIFTFTIIIAMLVSFFSLMSSMYTNIQEQSKEIGILRAIGIPKSWMKRLYVYEAFALVLSSSLMGLIIGVVVGWTFFLQQLLFTQLPIGFPFPWVLLIVIIGMSAVCAVLSSLSPIAAMLRNRVVQIMRMY